LNFIERLAETVIDQSLFAQKQPTAESIGRSAGLILIDEIQKKFNKSQEPKAKDRGTRLQLDPDTETPIPVIYGSSYIGGKIIDAQLTNLNRELWVAMVLSEQTGNKIDGSGSEFTFREIYWDGLKLEFQSDGVTVSAAYDEDGNSVDWSGLIQVYPFAGNSTSPVNLSGYSSGNSTAAYNLFPGWGTNHTMTDLVFALVKVRYDAKRDMNKFGNMQFRIENSMTKAGDVLFDYATNTRYGAGIPEAEINKE